MTPTAEPYAFWRKTQNLNETLAYEHCALRQPQSNRRCR